MGFYKMKIFMRLNKKTTKKFSQQCEHSAICPVTDGDNSGKQTDDRIHNDADMTN